MLSIIFPNSLFFMLIIRFNECLVKKGSSGFLNSRGNVAVSIKNYLNTSVP